MAFSYWALQISAKHFDEYLKSGETHRPKTWRSVLFFTSQFRSFFHWIVFNLFFLLCDSENDLYQIFITTFKTTFSQNFMFLTESEQFQHISAPLWILARILARSP